MNRHTPAMIGLALALGCAEQAPHHTGIPAPIWISQQVWRVGDAPPPSALGDAVPQVPDPRPPAEKVEAWIRQGEAFHALRFQLLEGKAPLWRSAEVHHAGDRPLWHAALQALKHIDLPTGHLRSRLDPQRCRVAAELAMAAGRLQQPILPLGQWYSGPGSPSGGFGGLSNRGALCVVARLAERRAAGAAPAPLLEGTLAALALEAQARGAVGWQLSQPIRLRWPAPAVLLLGALPDLARAEPAVAKRFIDRAGALLQPIAPADRAAVQRFVHDGMRWLPFATANQLARLPGLVVPEVERRRRQLVHSMRDRRVPVLWKTPAEPIANDPQPDRLLALLTWMVAQRQPGAAPTPPPALGPWTVTHRREGDALWVTVDGISTPLQRPPSPAPQHACTLKGQLRLRLGPGEAAWPDGCGPRVDPMADHVPSATWAQAANALAKTLDGAADPKAAGLTADGTGWARDTPLGQLRLTPSEFGWSWAATLGPWPLPIHRTLDGAGARLWAEHIARTATPKTRWAAVEQHFGRLYAPGDFRGEAFTSWADDDPRWGRYGVAELPLMAARAPDARAALPATIRAVPDAIRAVADLSVLPGDPYLAVMGWTPRTEPWPDPGRATPPAPVRRR